ncbi:hypothetical protein [Nonomuraea longicatena]|uniref:Integral membrane protein n=1 Tax=Nonomuraea longicatena TaxID=83682 RepID=A0ABP4AT95_9ACTN
MSPATALARALLALYPPTWRDRYAEEVTDLITSRPVRPRTLLTLATGAADAWIHHRHPLTLTRAALLALAAVVLAALWNPAIDERLTQPADPALLTTATTLFIAAAAQAVLPLLTTRRLTRAAVLLALPAGAAALYSTLALTGALTEYGHAGGPVAHATLGGLLAPLLITLALPLTTTAAGHDHSGATPRTAATCLAVAAILNTIAWLPVLAVLSAALPRTPWTAFAAAALSIGMSALAATTALTRTRTTRPRLAAL